MKYAQNFIQEVVELDTTFKQLKMHLTIFRILLLPYQNINFAF
jgi:hypothetical protein